MTGMNMRREFQEQGCGMKAGRYRRNYFIWSGIHRLPRDEFGWPRYWVDAVPTVVIDVDLASWALPFAIHGGGPLMGRPGFHFRIGPINIGWSKL